METDLKKKYEDAMARMELCERTGLEKKPDYIFPELAESDDERIGNVLYCIVRDNKEVKRILEGNGVSVDAALVYLEKQKESLHIPETCKENADSFTDEDERIRKWIIEEFKLHYDFESKSLNPMVEKALAWLEKQKAKERLDRMAPIYNDKESFEVGLEKAWKYYNESASRTVDSFEDNYIECVFSKGFREGFLYREKQKEQKPAEWSEEDEAYLQDALWCVKQAAKVARGENDMGTCWSAERWLKSLRPQPNWKPSDEQPEVDLEVRKQIEELANDWHHKGFASDEDCPLCMQDLMDILWHFYELGKKDMKEQMLKDAVEGYVNYYEDSGGILMAEAQVGCPYHNGDKVKIIIIKDDDK